MRPRRPPLTRPELLALPPATDIRTAARALSIGERKAYDLAGRGEFPVRCQRLGDTYRVITADLLRYLGIDRESADNGRPAA